MTPEILKCAWCGKEPRSYKGKIFCDTFGCLSDVNCPRDLVNWNLWQKRSLEMRCKDFQAGLMVVVNPLNGQPMSTFDDYIMGKHGEEEK